MKDWIQRNYPDMDAGKQYTYDQLRLIVRGAWDGITPEFLQDLLDSMKDRCQAVLGADGGHTKYRNLFVK